MKEFLKIINMNISYKNAPKINPQKQYWKNKLKNYIGKTAIYLNDTYKNDGSLVKIKNIYDNHITLEKTEYTKDSLFRCNILISVNFESFICNQARLVIIND